MWNSYVVCRLLQRPIDCKQLMSALKCPLTNDKIHKVKDLTEVCLGSLRVYNNMYIYISKYIRILHII